MRLFRSRKKILITQEQNLVRVKLPNGASACGTSLYEALGKLMLTNPTAFKVQIEMNPEDLYPKDGPYVTIKLKEYDTMLRLLGWSNK